MSLCRLTIVVDNKAAEGLVAEHGFSLYIERGDQRLLLDSGQKEALGPNMERLGINPAHLTSLVLSHGHYDHTGGLPAVLKIKGRVDVFGHPDIFRERVWASDDPDPKHRSAGA